jgi:hypothetical protein
VPKVIETKRFIAAWTCVTTPQSITHLDQISRFRFGSDTEIVNIDLCLQLPALIKERGLSRAHRREIGMHNFLQVSRRGSKARKSFAQLLRRCCNKVDVKWLSLIPYSSKCLNAHSSMLFKKATCTRNLHHIRIQGPQASTAHNQADLDFSLHFERVLEKNRAIPAWNNNSFVHWHIPRVDFSIASSQL